MNPEARRKEAIEAFREHVSSGKVAFFQQYGLDFVMGRREGPYLWDMAGQKRLFNLHCNGGVFNLGHRHPELVELLRRSLDDLDIGNHHLLSRARAELARLIARLMPGDLEYTVFGVSGGEAVDLALKVARAYTGRSGILSALGGYHGHTGLAMAAGDERYRRPFGPHPAGFRQVPFGDLRALAGAADRDTAAVLLETVPATLGIVVPSREYLQAVRALCDERGMLLILDEIQSGLGRTGRLWGFEHFGVLPDMVLLGKGLSGGLYPITATVLRKPLESVFHQDPFIHISTFGGAEIGCRIAQRVLEISSAPGFLAHVEELAKGFREGVLRLCRRHPRLLRELRQLGLMMGLRLRDELCGPLLTKTAYDQDLLLVYANNDPSVCQLLPPLNMPLDQVGWVMERLDRALGTARRLEPVLRLKRKVHRILGNRHEDRPRTPRAL